MASTTPFLSAISKRQTKYDLTAASPISDHRIVDLVNSIAIHVPSPFDVLSARFLVLLKDDHRKLWDLAREVMHEALPKDVFDKYFDERIAWYKRAHGTVLCFEDQDSLKGLKEKYESVIPPEKIDQWSEHSAGMHQFALWTAFCAEGLGCNLQHYNPTINEAIRKEWKVDGQWDLKAQLVFGTSESAGRKEREFKDLSGRVVVRGAEGR